MSAVTQEQLDALGRVHKRLELTYLVRGDDSRVHTPLRTGRAAWRDGALVATKDRADADVLARL